MVGDISGYLVFEKKDLSYKQPTLGLFSLFSSPRYLVLDLNKREGTLPKDALNQVWLKLTKRYC